MHGIRETHINWSMVLPETGLEEYWSITGGLSVVSDIGSTQLRHGELGTDPITFDVINKWTRKAGGILRVSTRFSLGVENEQADAARGGRTCPAEIKFSGANGDREKTVFFVQLTTSRIGSLTRLIHTLQLLWM